MDGYTLSILVKQRRRCALPYRKITIVLVSWASVQRKTKLEQDSTRVLDYSETISEYERESLAAEAQLKAERKNLPKPAKG